MHDEKNAFLTFVKRGQTRKHVAETEDTTRRAFLPPLPIFFIELVHRIRNPLVSIKTFTQLLREKFNDAEYRDYFYRIVTKILKKLTLF